MLMTLCQDMVTGIKANAYESAVPLTWLNLLPGLATLTRATHLKLRGRAEHLGNRLPKCDTGNDDAD